MKRPRSTFNLLLLLLATSLPCMWLAWRLAVPGDQRSLDNSVPIKLHVEGGTERIDLIQKPDATYSFVLQRGSEHEEELTPDELAERLFHEESSRDWLSRVLNISSQAGMIWVGIGLLGQVLFTGRMVIQWLASEKKRRSVVPPLFWWCSLIGALMLLIYFMWRRDIVGVLGQSFGLVVYIRNLYFIQGMHRRAAALHDPALHPKVAEPVATSPDDAFNNR